MFFSLIPPLNLVLNLRELICHEMQVHDLQETVNLCECIFQDFDILANKGEIGCTRKKPDIRYIWSH